MVLFYWFFLFIIEASPFAIPVLFPKSKNKLTFTCSRVIEENNTLCDNTFSVTSEELLKNKGFNNLDVIPEGMR